MRDRKLDIQSKIDQLPPAEQAEVQHFVEFLLEKKRRQKHGKPRFDWEGALEELKDQYTSVELQHKILELREE